MKWVHFCIASLTAIAPLFSGEYRVVDLKEFPAMGLFAAANQILGQLYLYENRSSISGLKVDFGSNGLYYDPEYGTNWWEYYFSPIALGTDELAAAKYPCKEECYEAFRVRKQLGKLQAAELIRKYIRVKQPILDKVDQFAKANFSDFYIIGIHYRGTDKDSEAPRVPYRSVVEKIQEHLPANGKYRIFVATDEAKFLEYMKKKFPTSVLYREAHRSSNRVGVHFSGTAQYEIGEESVIDSLLLSKCNLLIRTSSNLSLWSTYFNPDLRAILLNENYRSSQNIEVE